MIKQLCWDLMVKHKRKVIALNDQGYRIGSSHHNSTIPDELIDTIRDLHEDDALGYRKLAKMFNMSINTVRKICTYERRAQTPDRWKTINEPEKK